MRHFSSYASTLGLIKEIIVPSRVTPVFLPHDAACADVATVAGIATAVVVNTASVTRPPFEENLIGYTFFVTGFEDPRAARGTTH